MKDELSNDIYNFLINRFDRAVCVGEIYNDFIKDKIIKNADKPIFKKKCYLIDMQYDNIHKMMFRESLYLLYSKKNNLNNLITNTIISKNILLFNEKEIIDYTYDAMQYKKFNVNAVIDNLNNTIITYILSLSDINTTLAEFLDTCLNKNFIIYFDDIEYTIQDVVFENNESIKYFIINNHKESVKLLNLEKRMNIIERKINNFPNINKKIILVIIFQICFYLLYINIGYF
jgi:hypothetical protein